MLPATDAAVLFTVMVGVQLVPISISGWGLRELAVISLLGNYGIAPGRALLLSVCFGLVFAVELGWLPVTATAPQGSGFFIQLKYLILPVIPLVMVLFGYIARMARVGTVEELDSDYARTAILKGLPRGVVIRRHVLRNSLLPTITVIATQTGYLIGGLVVVEVLFRYNGIGLLTYNAANQHDIPMLEACVLTIGVVVGVRAPDRGAIDADQEPLVIEAAKSRRPDKGTRDPHQDERQENNDRRDQPAAAGEPEPQRRARRRCGLEGANAHARASSRSISPPSAGHMIARSVRSFAAISATNRPLYSTITRSQR